MNSTTGTRLAIFLPSLGGGGAERAMLNLAVGFSERGFKTDLVLARATGPYLAHVPSTVRIVDLNVPRVARAVLPLRAYLRRERPTVLLSALDHANLVAMTAARTSGVRTRTVISIQNTMRLALNETAEARVRAIPWLLKLVHRWADEIVAVSGGTAEDFARVTGIPRNRVRVIYNPVVTPALMSAASQPPSHEWFKDPARPVILGIGRLTRQKNFPALIEAFALVKRRHNARLVILGEGPDRPALEALIHRRGIQDHVLLPGFVENPYSWLAASALFALSSDWEGLPSVLIESLAVGTPVVSTDCDSGPREILRNGSLGALVPVGDISALASAISRALDGPSVRPPADALQPFTLNAALECFQELIEVDA